MLSPTTERIDRTEKLHAYRRVESLREYVLAAQDMILVEIHRRGAGDEWTREILTTPEDQLPLASIGLTLNLSDVYRNVRFDEAQED